MSDEIAARSVQRPSSTLCSISERFALTQDIYEPIVTVGENFSFIQTDRRSITTAIECRNAVRLRRLEPDVVPKTSKLSHAISRLFQHRDEIVSPNQMTGAERYEDRRAMCRKMPFECFEPDLIAVDDERSVKIPLPVKFARQHFR